MANSTNKYVRLTNEQDAGDEPMLVPPPPDYTPIAAPLNQPTSFCGPVISQQPNAPMTNSGGGFSVVNVQQVQQSPTQPQIIYVRQQPFSENDNTLCCAVFATLCCCWIIGLFAIYYAFRARNEWNSGDQQRAQSLNGVAKGLTIATIICGIVIIGIYVCLQILAGNRINKYKVYA
jgi:hypothetical protein